MKVLLIAAITALLLSTLIVLTKRMHGRFSLDEIEGVQKAHVGRIPRIGGIAIFLSLLLTLMNASTRQYEILFPLLIASLPVFLLGLGEDLTKRVGVTARFAASVLSAVLICYLIDLHISRVDIPGIDLLLSIAPISILFTIIAITSFTHSINIIDGANGLASGVVVISCVAIGMMAYQAGDDSLAEISFIIAAVTIGFFLLNYPFGKIFLGDGGAYLLGFILACIAILLPLRNPSISSWAPLVVCAYPILEICFSVTRRRQRLKGSTQPDRLHLHSLIMSRISSRLLSTFKVNIQNSLVATYLLPVVILNSIMVVIFKESTPILLGILILDMIAYMAWYRRFIYFGWRVSKV
jgi:UDP-N-acetylmuramyl pentapeptide phosphotransferase/UDP-N-acetylglucosamine-1-phosphate transferase